MSDTERAPDKVAGGEVEVLRVASASACFDEFYGRGWTDGLPVIPPTRELVDRMMSTVDLPPDHLVGNLAPRTGAATIERIAINAVMAGCLPAYFPVLVTAIEIAAAPSFGLLGVNSTTNPAVPMIIVNGPIRNEIGINCGYSVLGPGYRANSTIGRAFSLCMINIAGRSVGDICKSTHKHPGAYTMCIGEYEERSPWESLHVERGFGRDESTVSILTTTGTTSMLAHDCSSGEEILTVFAGSTAIVGSNNMFIGYGSGQATFVVSPDHATVIARDFTKQEAKEFLLRNTVKLPVSWLPAARKQAILANPPDQLEEGHLRLAKDADGFTLVVAGGPGGYYSTYIPGGRLHTRPIMHRRH